MANQSAKKEASQAGPLAIAGAVAALILVLGFCWYRFMGSGSDSGVPHFTKNAPPIDSMPPAVRAMYEKKPASGQAASAVSVEPR